jgi:hypothetical protein
MNVSDALQLITAVLACSAAVIGLVNRRKIHNVHVDLNSRLSQLVASEYARGLSEASAAATAAHDAGAGVEGS